MMNAPVSLWDAASGKLIASLIDPRFFDVLYCAFSPDGTRILTASIDDTARLWDAASGKLTVSFDLGPAWSGMDFLEADRPALHLSPDSARVLAASADHTAKRLFEKSWQLPGEYVGCASKFWRQE